MASSGAKWMEQSYYEGIPNSEVNWAQLAQNWMAMRDVGDGLGQGALPLPPPSKSKPVEPVVEFGESLPLPMNGSNFGAPPPPQFFVPDAGGFGGGPPPPPWIPPPPSNFPPDAAAFPPLMPPPPPWMENSPVTVQGALPMNSYNYQADHEQEEEGGEYSHYYKEWDEKQKMEQHRRENEFEEVEGIPQGAMAHWMAPPNQWGSAANNWLRQGSRTQAMQVPYIDQQTRKVLPAWIREGLEKAEKERQKKVEKETKMRVAEEAAMARRAAKGLGKFDSDSSDEESGSEGRYRSNGRADDGEPVFGRKTDGSTHLLELKEQRNVVVEEVDLRSDEEKREDALLVLRRLLTEVLLETTNKEVERIALEKIENENRKQAQPKILVQSSALAALFSLGAGSDEESDEEEDRKRSSDVETDDEHTASSGSASPKESAGDGLFKTPLLVRPATGAKSKAKLSSHDGGNSTTQPQGNNSNYGENIADLDDFSSASVSNHADVAVQEDTADFSEEGEKMKKRRRSSEKSTSKSADRIRHSRKRSRSRSKEEKTKRYSNRNSDRHRSRSKERNVRSKRRASSSSSDSSSTEPSRETSKRGRLRSKERKERSRRRSVSASSEDSEDRSSSSRSKSATPERYRHRSRSKERHSKTSRKRSSSRDREHSRRSNERKRSRSREKRSSHSHYKSHDEKRSRKVY